MKVEEDITDDLSDREFLDLLERDLHVYNNGPWRRRHIELTDNIRYLRNGVMYQSLDDMLEAVFKQQTRI